MASGGRSIGDYARRARALMSDVRVRTLVLFLLTAAVTFGIEYWVAGRAADSSGFREALFGLSGTYQRVVTAGPREQAARFTALITIAPAREGDAISARNVCAQRAFMSHLLEAISRARPSVIVLDKFYSPDICPAGDPGTTRFLQTVRRITEAGLTVLVARRIAEDLPVVRPSSPGPAPDPAGYLLEPSLRFPATAGGAAVGQGLAHFSRDTRRVALGYDVREPHETDAYFLDGLALAAARAHEPEPRLTRSRPRLKRYLEDGIQPFVSFIPLARVEEVTATATDVLCHGLAPSVVRRGWRACSTHTPFPLGILKSRVVVIGELSEADYHDTVLGAMVGAALHVQYIEGLLDDRLFSPAGFWPDMFVGFGIYAVIEFLFARFKARPLALLVRTAAVFLVAWASIYLLATNFGILLQPVLISLIALQLRAVGLVYSRFEAPPVVKTAVT